MDKALNTLEFKVNCPQALFRIKPDSMLQTLQQIGQIKTDTLIKNMLLTFSFYFLSGIVAFANIVSVDPPTDITLSKDNIDEHCPISTLVGNFSAVDTDGGSYTWTLVAGAGASGNMSFDIPTSSSSLLSDEIFNYESQTSYSIQVQVKDENNATFSKSFTININDIDEANLTSTIALSSESIGEGNDIGDEVGTLITNGVHAGTNHVYSLSSGSGSTNNSSFSISGNQLLAAEIFDEDVKNSYSIRVRSDSQEGESVFKVYTITIDRVNNEPTDITLTDNSFEENRSVGYRVGFLNTTDADDDGESYTYSFVEGDGDDDNDKFDISFSSFELATEFDFEMESTHSVRVRTEDGNGGSFEKALTILVEDSPFEPITDIFLSHNDIDEEKNIGFAIGTLTSEDDDAGDVHTYVIRTIDGSTDHTAFSIDGDVLKSAIEFDFETQTSYTIRIRSLDGTGFFLDKDFSITINDVIEPIIWDGDAWSNGTGPSFADNVIIDGNYDVETEGAFPSNNLTINSGNGLTIDGNSTLTIIGDVLINGGLTVYSGSSLMTYEDDLFIGSAVFYRTTRYADGKYSMVGTPLKQNNINTADDLGPTASDVYMYDETVAYGADGINRWLTASTEELVPGKGYAQANKQTLFFLGKPNVGTITVSGTYTEDAADANEGWNLIANPYATAIDIGDFLAENSNTAGAVYIWDDNGSNTQRGTNADYIIANGTMATNTTAAGGHTRYNNHLGSVQGFFVKLNSAADTDINFTEDMRVSGNNSDDNFFRETELPIARLNLTNNEGLFKQAVIGFAEDATENELNRTYDAQAFNATSDFGLFTMKAGRALALNGMPNEWETVQLQFNVQEAGLYTISVQLEGSGQSLYLMDKLTGEVIDLRNGEYSFTTQSGIHADRFELVSSPFAVLNTKLDEAKVFAFDKTLHIQQHGNEDRVYQLFNMDGRLLFSTRVESTKEIDLNHLSGGIYLVFDGQKTHKIILD